MPLPLTTAVTVGSTAVCTGGCFAFVARKQLVKTADNQTLLNELADRGYDIGSLDAEAKIEREYERQDALGKGASGTVFKVRHRATGKFFAMKVIVKGSGNDGMNDQESLETEIRCMKRLRHRHIVNLEDVIENNQKVFIVMDCADGGMLYDRILALDHFSEKSAASLIKQVLKAVHYMHSNGVVHRDLKPENILLTNNMEDEDNDIKVADFGLAVDLHFDGYHPEESMRLKESKDIEGGFCGSPIAMAPEVAMKGAKYGPQVDIWSLGCMTYELLDGKPPFVAKNARALFKLVKESPGPDFCRGAWKNISKDAKDITGQMLQKLPQNRPSAREALQHQWFKAAPDRHLEDAHSTIVSRRTTARGEDYEEDEVDKTLEGTHTAAKLVGGTKAP